jgi:ATP-dependent DNA helicase UvrD/PcrA
MEWSHYSKAIFAAYSDSTDNIIVQACPGAGKTTNICHIWSLDDKPTVYLVFNKHTQMEAQHKLPQKSGSDVLTLNGLGHRAIYNTFGRVKLDDKKVMNIIREQKRDRYTTDKQREQQYTLAKAVSIAKCIDIDGVFTLDEYEHMMSMYDIDDYEGLYSDIRRVLDVSDNMVHTIDFADQLRFPVLYNCAMPSYGVVLGDEVQDFNPIQAALLEVLGAKRYILVGDSHQSIYGFRGAMNDSMPFLKQRFRCQELPLSINYRCSPQIVSQAAQIYPGILPWEESPEGIVRYSDVNKELCSLSANDIVLCRTNRPLIALAYELLRSNIPCFVRGRDIGHGLIALIKKQHASTVQALIAALYASFDVEMYKAAQKDDSAKRQRIEDKYNSALLFCERAARLDDSPEVVCSAINALFDNGRGVCLTTVHKAKGLEAHRALLLDHGLFGIYESRATHLWQQEQERNIHYVAVTRAQRELVYM